VTTRDASGARVTWLVDASGNAPKPLPLPEGVALYHNTFSPDGMHFVARCADSRAHCVYETDSGRAEPLEHTEAQWVPVAWDREDRVFFRDRSKMIPEELWRVDVASGEAERVAEISPRDRAGILGLTRLTVAQSGEAWAYSFMRRLSDLYVVSGLE
jgi:hypothetical protein